MKRVRVFGLTALAAFALVATTAASASAHEFLILGNPVPSGGETFTSVNKSGTKAVLKTSGLEVLCSVVSNEGKILPAGKSDVTVKFSSCTVDKPANCKVKEPIVVKATDVLVEPFTTLLDEFAPETGKKFVTLEFENNGGTCSLGKTEVEGKAAAVVVSPGVEKEVGELDFTVASNEEASEPLTAGGLEATFTLEDQITLTSKDLWKAV